MLQLLRHEFVLFVLQVLHFMMAAVRSGNGPALMHVLVDLLHPLLSLQVGFTENLTVSSDLNNDAGWERGFLLKPYAKDITLKAFGLL